MSQEVEEFHNFLDHPFPTNTVNSVMTLWKIWVYLHPMLHFSSGCCIQDKILANLELLKGNLLIFPRKISQNQKYFFETFLEFLWWFWVSNQFVLGTFLSKMTSCHIPMSQIPVYLIRSCRLFQIWKNWKFDDPPSDLIGGKIV